jgi:hypothetical protein
MSITTFPLAQRLLDEPRDGITPVLLGSLSDWVEGDTA